MKEIIAMIPAAGRGKRMDSLTSDLPKSMLKVNDKPIIAWHLDKIINEGINKVCIIVGYKKEILIDFVNENYNDKLDIMYTEQKELKGLGHAIGLGIQDIISKYSSIDKYKLLILLGDNIVKDKLSNFCMEYDDFIAYKNVVDYQRWGLLITDDNDYIINSIEKPDYDPGTRKAIIGVYLFNDICLLKSCIDLIIKENIMIKNEYQITTAISIYNKNIKIKAIKFDGWYDCGDIPTYNETLKNI